MTVTLATDKTDSTLQASDHPAHHNSLASAVNDLNIAVLTIAASNTPDRFKDRADYTCDGTLDQEQFQAANDQFQTWGVPGIIMPLMGDFNFTSNTVLTINQRCGIWGQGTGASRIIQAGTSWTSQSTAMIVYAGTLAGSATTTTTATVDEGDIVIPVTSGAALAEDSYYILGSTADYSPDDTQGDKGEIVKIADVTGNNATIYGQVLDEYLTADTAQLRLITMLRGAFMRDISIDCNDTSTNKAQMVRFAECLDPFVNNVEIIQGGGPGFQFRNCYGGIFEGNAVNNLTNDSSNNHFGYGIDLARATTRLIINNNTFKNGRHAITTNGSGNEMGVPHHITISQNNVSEFADSALDTHNQGSNIVFDSNHVSNCRTDGMQIRCRAVTAKNNHFENCYNGIYIHETAFGVLLKDNTFRHMLNEVSTSITNSDGATITFDGTDTGGQGIVLGTSSGGDGPDGVTVDGNVMEYLYRDGIRLRATNMDGITITNNTIVNTGQGNASNRKSGILIGSTTVLTDSLITGNSFHKRPSTTERGTDGTNMDFGIRNLSTSFTGNDLSGNVAFGIPLLSDVSSNIVTRIGEAILINKSADQTCPQSDTTVNDDTHLQLTLPASTTWEVEGCIIYTASQVADLKMGFAGPSGATMDWASYGLSTADGDGVGDIVTNYRTISDTQGVGGMGTTAGTDKLTARPKGKLTISTTAGIFKFQWCQNTTEATDVIVYQNSWLKLTRLA